jgi:hypothetical protein
VDIGSVSQPRAGDSKKIFLRRCFIYQRSYVLASRKPSNTFVI